MKKLMVIPFALVFAACAHSKGPMATATLDSTSGSTAKGTVHFQDAGENGVEVVADLTGVPPGVHGFHVHEKGDCGNNGNNAGPHFNPTTMVHGAPDAVSHHAGDFGNVTADDKGEVHARFTTHSITINTGERAVVGHAVVLHGNPDDLVSQPAGNAGPRIACGVTTLMGSMQP
ncbi:MAG: superoxide dismutase, Cu-Zn family [Thermoanaerobaculia bacterium]|jgi:Cu-Zn family superoxide dismutase|nr:superoxide dismutase, Cu-Zn family [Thermoanaerobaculia bacterium]